MALSIQPGTMVNRERWSGIRKESFGWYREVIRTNGWDFFQRKMIDYPTESFEKICKKEFIMKKYCKRFAAIALIAALLLGLCGSALAAAATTPVEGVRDSRITVTVDGKEVDLGGVQPIIVDGSTYLPVRALAEALGMDVDWDQETRQVQLATGGETAIEKTVDGTPIQPTSAVSSLEDLADAGLNQYFEVGGLRVVKLQEGIFHIDEGTTANPNGPTNNGSSIYLVIGEDTAAIIDGGNGERGNANFKDSDMAEIVQALVGDREMKVIITHSHGDHTGLFQDEDSYSVVPKDIPFYISEDDLDTLAGAVKEKYTVNTLKDGEEIEAGGRTLHVVTMPAHTDGSVVLIDYENDVIFSGDTIGSGTVWLFSEDNLVQYNRSVRKLATLIEDMNDPIFYAGHRWQQGDPAVSSAGICVQEMGKTYVLETVKLLDDIKSGNYELAETYAPSSDPGNDYPMYSAASDLNQDGIIPGIYALPVAVEGFIPDTAE